MQPARVWLPRRTATDGRRTPLQPLQQQKSRLPTGRPLLRGPPPLACAARRFIAPHLSPAPHPDAADITAHLPDLAASALREANCSLPLGRSLKAIVNDRGSVTLIVLHTSVPPASYTPYFEALTTKLNQSFPIGTNTAFHSNSPPLQLNTRAIHSV